MLLFEQVCYAEAQGFNDNFSVTARKTIEEHSPIISLANAQAGLSVVMGWAPSAVSDEVVAEVL